MTRFAAPTARRRIGPAAQGGLRPPFPWRPLLLCPRVKQAATWPGRSTLMKKISKEEEIDLDVVIKPLKENKFGKRAAVRDYG